MAKALLILLSIVLGALGTLTIILAFAYQSVGILLLAIGIFVISVMSLVFAFEEKTPRKETPSPPIKVGAPIKMNPNKPTTQEKSEKPKPVKPTKATVLPPNTIYCTYCGKQIPEDSLFCPNCGSSME
jgi:hypothetical protein